MKHITYPHPDDRIVDAVVLEMCGPRHLACVTTERWADGPTGAGEWRFGAEWWVVGDVTQRLGVESGLVSMACLELFRAVYTATPAPPACPTRGMRLERYRFMRKGVDLVSHPAPSRGMDLFAAAGHLPSVFADILEEIDSPPDDEQHCAQPGCPRLGVATYALRFLVDADGNRTRPWVFADGRRIGRYARHFCARHLDRGGEGGEDANQNYIRVLPTHEEDPPTADLDPTEPPEAVEVVREALRRLRPQGEDR